jgi:hypothetical protein
MLNRMDDRHFAYITKLRGEKPKKKEKKTID